ncbi:MAG TPA: response regulator [Gammaproteobacteria bacterium]|nr:response regulator [Gammaproteobacteria bacterium]
MNPQRTLLLVDDEENILRALTRVLRGDGYRILRASGGGEGLTLLAKHPEVGVILSDQRMPSMTGIDFLSQVRERYPDTVRMILSGYTDLQTVTGAINEGAVYKFLTKPWEDELLRANVEEAFRHCELGRENERLTRELQASNEELERRVEEKTRQVLLNQRVLAISQEVLEHLPAGVLGIDDDGIIVLANRQAHALLSRSGQNLLDQAAGTLLSPAICALFRHATDQPADARDIPLGETAVDVHCGRMGQDTQSQGTLVVLTQP